MFWENFWSNLLSSIFAGIILLILGGLVTYYQGKYIYNKFSKKFNAKAIAQDYDKSNVGGNHIMGNIGRDLNIFNMRDTTNTSAKVDANKIYESGMEQFKDSLKNK